WWGWLEELSGPGPFYVAGAEVPIVCVWETQTGDKQTARCWARRDLSERRFLSEFFSIRGAAGSSGDRPRFKDVAGNTDPVRVIMAEPMFTTRITPMLDIA